MTYPEVSFDVEADVLYVRLSGAEVRKTVALSDLRLIDYAEDRSVIGIEFVGASAGVDLEDVPFAPDVARAIGDSGLPIRTFA